MAHKSDRQVAIGPYATLYFEDRLTMQYQVQEILRIERVYEAEGIEDELAACNPLIPDGYESNTRFITTLSMPCRKTCAARWLATLAEAGVTAMEISRVRDPARWCHGARHRPGLGMRMTHSAHTQVVCNEHFENLFYQRSTNSRNRSD